MPFTNIYGQNDEKENINESKSKCPVTAVMNNGKSDKNRTL